MERQPEFNIDIFPRITKVAEGIKKILNLGRVTEPCLSEHKRGAAEMLDRAMDNQPELPFDDMGNYTSFVEGR